MKWSDSQLQAIKTRGCDLLVAAAAGSGKTAVLVERIIDRITNPGLDGSAPTDIDRLLVVTFTNAAAAEMRTRIATRLNVLQQQQPSPRLARQAALLATASISTLHAFCQTVIRKYFYSLDLDPGFRIATAAEIDLLQIDVLEQLLAKSYEADLPEFNLLIEHYADTDGDNGLMQLILSIYEFSRSHPWPRYWLNALAERFDLAPTIQFEDTLWAPILRQEIFLQIENCIWQLDHLIKDAEIDPDFATYADTFAADCELLGELLLSAQHSWPPLEQNMTALEFSKLKTVKTGSEERREYFKSGRDKVKRRLAQLREQYFSQPSQAAVEDLRKVRPVIGALVKLVEQFDTAFNAAKQKRNILDFSDLEHYCLAVLLAADGDPEHPHPSAAALELQQQFTEILIDEYQDTNEVQELILKLVSAGHNRFMVGDVKQSIYRFRLAEPRLFLTKYRSYPAEAGHLEQRINLTANFRSRAAVLEAINFLFGQLLNPVVSELSYNQEEQLVPALEYPPTQNSLAGVEVKLFERQAPELDQPLDTGSAFAREAAWIAERIQALMTGGYQVYTDGAYRPLAWRDIVILLRSVKGKAPVLLQALRTAGIPCYADIDTGYFQETEVGIVLSLLQVLDNPRQDIHLAGSLRSPLFMFSEAELALLRLAAPSAAVTRDLWDCLINCAQDTGSELAAKAQTALDTLRSWRRLSRCSSVAELLWRIYETSGLYDYVGAMPGGIFRQANLRALFDRARQFEQTNYRGLFRFLRFIEAMTERGGDLAVARALGENENVVRVMSIHKSKGLEFPVVFVADLGKEINFSDSKDTMLCHRDLGVGPYVTIPEQDFRYPTLARRAISCQLNYETRAEELRVLYVAFTRAREKLILVGSVRDLNTKCVAWTQTACDSDKLLPARQIAAAKTYLDLLLPAIARHPDGEPIRALAEADYALPAALKAAADASKWQINTTTAQPLVPSSVAATFEPELLIAIKELAPLPPSDSAQSVAEVLNWRYPYTAAAAQPAKLTVTEVKRRLTAETTDKNLFAAANYAAPSFGQRHKLTAAEIGILTHLVMQRLQSEHGLDAVSIARQLEFMVAAELLLSEEAAAINVNALARFFAGELGTRLQHALWVKRELPFSIMLPATQFTQEQLPSQDQILIQGTVDCLFAEQDGLVLVDYKTDTVDNIEQLSERYQLQLTLYAQAIAAIIGQPVKEKYVYSFRLHQAVAIE